MEASACAWQACSAVLAFFSAGAAMAVVAESSSEKMTINRMVFSLLNMPRRRPAVVEWIRPESVRTACSLKTPKDDQHDDTDQRNEADQPPPAASVRVVQPAYAHRERR